MSEVTIVPTENGPYEVTGADGAFLANAVRSSRKDVRDAVVAARKAWPGWAELTALEGAGSVRLTWEPASAPCTTTVRMLDDPMLSDVWGDQLTRLEVDVTALGPTGTIVWTIEEAQ